LDSGYYAACSALKAQSNALEIAANNIANVTTSGFRGQIPSFESHLVETAGVSMGAWEHLVNEQAQIQGSRLDLTQGNLERTGNPMDFAISGPGFFAVQAKAGTMYTRNGSFQVSAAGKLVTAAGDSVLGDSGPIDLPPGTVAISADGTISVGGAVAGKLRLVEFASPTALTAVGGSYYSALASAEKTATASTVQQGMLESSNVNSVMAMVGLLTAERQAEMAERAMTAFDSTFNRLAADELPRVS
jgi:flagellar basal-body rod protein FlgF/flagellar basal-body rod protein FlgG